jgi:hypothetical protein
MLGGLRRWGKYVSFSLQKAGARSNRGRPRAGIQNKKGKGFVGVIARGRRGGGRGGRARGAGGGGSLSRSSNDAALRARRLCKNVLCEESPVAQRFEAAGRRRCAARPPGAATQTKESAWAWFVFFVLHIKVTQCFPMGYILYVAGSVLMRCVLVVVVVVGARRCRRRGWVVGWGAQEMGPRARVGEHEGGGGGRPALFSARMRGRVLAVIGVGLGLAGGGGGGGAPTLG